MELRVLALTQDKQLVAHDRAAERKGEVAQFGALADACTQGTDMKGRAPLAGDLDVVDLGPAPNLEIERGVDLGVEVVRAFVAFHQRQLRAGRTDDPRTRE